MAGMYSTRGGFDRLDQENPLFMEALRNDDGKVFGANSLLGFAKDVMSGRLIVDAATHADVQKAHELHERRAAEADVMASIGLFVDALADVSMETLPEEPAIQGPEAIIREAIEAKLTEIGA